MFTWVVAADWRKHHIRILDRAVQVILAQQAFVVVVYVAIVEAAACEIGFAWALHGAFVHRAHVNHFRVGQWGGFIRVFLVVVQRASFKINQVK